MKKIFIIVPTLGTGGGEKIAIEILKNIQKDRYNAVLYCLFEKKETIYSKELEKLNIEVKYLDKKLGVDLGVIWKLIKIMRREKPDIVHTHLNVMQFVLPALIMANIKMRIHTVHSLADKESSGILRKIMFLAFKIFNVKPIGISDVVSRSIANQYKLKESQVTCIYNGIDLNRYRKKEEVQDDNVKFICVGTLYAVKNQELIIRAFHNIHIKYMNTKLTIIGDGQLKENLEALINDLNLKNCVDMKGIIPNTEEELGQADIFLMSSIYEGLPLSILEAMAIGLPIISTKVGGIPDIVEHMGNGILVESKNQNNFEKAMETLILDNKLRSKLGQKSLELSRKYDVKKMTREYEKIYDRR